MTTIQWIMILLAGILIAPNIIQMIPFGKIKEMLSQKDVQLKPLDRIVVVGRQEETDPHGECDGLVDVVKCWENLIDCCQAQGMTEAAKQLQGIFPLFVVKNGETNGQ